MKILNFEKPGYLDIKGRYDCAYLWRIRFCKAIEERRILRGHLEWIKNAEIRDLIKAEIRVNTQIARLSLSLYRMNVRAAQKMTKRAA